MKLFYLAAPSTIAENAQLFREWHAIPLTEELWLAGIIFGDEGAESAWSATPGVSSLPHTLAGGPIGPEIAALLHSLGVGAQHTTFDVAEAAGKIHPLMRARVH